MNVAKEDGEAKPQLQVAEGRGAMQFLAEDELLLTAASIIAIPAFVSLGEPLTFTEFL